MRKYKIRKKDFERIFTRRKLTLRERYMQTFWFVDCESHYELHQKISLLCLIVSPIFYLLLTVPIFLVRGLIGVCDMYKYFLPYAMGKPLRVDGCYHKVETTEALIKLAGWDK